MELVSVIVPVYNVEKYIYRCIDSILAQTYKNIEIIVVDDESPDKCGIICDELANKYANIRVVHKKNGGLGYARNSGIEIAKGEYITFIDSDDWISKDHIENLVECIKRTNSDLCIGGHTSTRGENDTSCHKNPSRLKCGIYQDTAIIDELLLPLIGPDTKYPKDVQLESSCCMNLYKLGIIKENDIRFISERDAVAEDIYFNIDYLSKCRKVYISDEVGYFYFYNPESISRKFNPNRFARTKNFFYEIQKRVELLGLKNTIEYRIHRSYLTKIRVAIRLIVLSDMKFHQKIKEIKVILKDELTKRVLIEYPVDTFIPAFRITAYMMKYELSLPLYFMISLREKLDHSALAVNMLRKIGIGR